MMHTFKFVAAMAILLLVSTACELGISASTPVPAAPEDVELSVLISPAGVGYVEYDGAIIDDGVAVPVKDGKLVNLVAKSSDAEWRFARWERDLSGTNAGEALQMDGSKVVRAVFAPVSTPAPASAQTAPLVAVGVAPAPAPRQTPTPVPVVAAPQPTPVPGSATAPSTPTPVPTAAPAPTPVLPPEPSFTVDVSSGSAPLTVRFTDSSRGSATSVEWDFGDGTTSAETSPTHEYTVAGFHTVRLTLMGLGGAETFTLTEPIVVIPGPLVNIEIRPAQIELRVRETVALTAIAQDQFGNEIGDALVTWAATGPMGSVDDSGLLTAGTQTGTFERLVQATAVRDEETLQISADVIINPGALAVAAIEPPEVTLDIDTSQSFSVTATDQFENLVPDGLVSWSLPAELGVIDTNGTFTAGTRAGAFPGSIRADVVSGSDGASAAADVSIRPDALATIDVQPANFIVESGYLHQLTAVGLDAYGNEIPDLPFAWEVAGGEIDRDGLFTAGSQGGSFVITASATFKDVDGAPAVMVEIPPASLISDQHPRSICLEEPRSETATR